MVYYTYPQTVLKNDQKAHLADIMDSSYEEGFFTQKFGELVSINYYFEIRAIKIEEWIMTEDTQIPVTEKIAAFVADTRAENIPEEMYRHARVAFMDWVAVTLGGKDDPLVEKLIGYADKLGGLPQATWVLIDCIDVVVHLFDADHRSYYDLEMLWGDAPRLRWQRRRAKPSNPAD